jgi:primase-polymerase (primpol)-like protein
MSLLKVYVDGVRDVANDIADMLSLLDYTESITRKQNGVFVVRYDETKGDIVEDLVTILDTMVTSERRPLSVRIVRAHRVSASAYMAQHQLIVIDVSRRDVSISADRIFDDTEQVQNAVLLERIRKANNRRSL